MPSSRILEIAKKIAIKDRVVFDSLLEFEKTGKIKTKERLTFTIDKNIALNFRRFCRKKGYNMSAKIEKAIEDIINGG